MLQNSESHKSFNYKLEYHILFDSKLSHIAISQFLYKRNI
jgi:hypothetical protein